MGRDNPTRVIVGAGGSMAGLRGLRLAVAEARRRGAQLHAVRVWNEDAVWQAGQGCFTGQGDQRAWYDVRATFAATMGREPEDVDVWLMTVMGRAGRALVDYAYQDDDVLVVGTAQRGIRRGLSALGG